MSHAGDALRGVHGEPAEQRLPAARLQRSPAAPRVMRSLAIAAGACLAWGAAASVEAVEVVAISRAAMPAAAEGRPLMAVSPMDHWIRPVAHYEDLTYFDLAPHLRSAAAATAPAVSSQSWTFDSFRSPAGHVSTSNVPAPLLRVDRPAAANSIDLFGELAAANRSVASAAPGTAQVPPPAVEVPVAEPRPAAEIGGQLAAIASAPQAAPPQRAPDATPSNSAPAAEEASLPASNWLAAETARRPAAWLASQSGGAEEEAPVGALPTPAPFSPTPGVEGDGTITGAPRLGEAPADTRLQFLRFDTVLLEPGEYQWDVGLVYFYRQFDVPVLVVDVNDEIEGVALGQIRDRRLFVPFGVRYGLTRRTQLFASLPVGWASTEFSIVGEDEFDHHGAVGDLTFGFSYLCASNECQDVVFTFAATAPTGGHPFTDLALPGAALGEGFWALSGDLLCIRTYDPVVVFTSIGTRQFFQREFLGADILPGAEYRWSLGVGMAVNPQVTLSTRFTASYIPEVRVDGERVPGTIQEPMSIRMAATIAQCGRWVEPFVEFGTNRDAVSTMFGVVYTY